MFTNDRIIIFSFSFPLFFFVGGGGVVAFFSLQFLLVFQPLCYLLTQRISQCKQYILNCLVKIIATTCSDRYHELERIELGDLIKVGPYISDGITYSSVYTLFKIFNYHYWKITELLYRPCINKIVLVAEKCLIFCTFRTFWSVSYIRFKILLWKHMVGYKCTFHFIFLQKY